MPARVAPQGRILRSTPAHNAYVFGMETPLNSLYTMRVFLIWKRRCADVRAGTQAPPLRFRLGGLRVDVRPYARLSHQGHICCSSDAGMALSFGVEKVVFIFICIFASNKNVNQEQSWNV